ncbi:hypothetical protein M8J76_000152 [Diaphorina citri]|nr:hypothetical protein M8J75_003224 [Diaphorina citri]KAI5716056.1 hypothetical protein M8J76_000152 [Diaphorina citri]KAI5718285.1 hypothetical protein M8J77_019041 [Diaphorina citri]
MAQHIQTNSNHHNSHHTNGSNSNHRAALSLALTRQEAEILYKVQRHDNLLLSSFGSRREGHWLGNTPSKMKQLKVKQIYSKQY